MNKKGLFCFLIVLCFASIETAQQQEALIEKKSFEETKALCLEIESLDLKRTMLEENTDFLIKQTLEEQVRNGNTDNEQIKQAVNEKIILFLEKASGNKLEQESLDDNSKVLVINYENFYLAEYSYTGGILKNNKFSLKLGTENAEKEFEIPIGYFLRTTVLK
jgi:hypothetical protein